MRILVTGKTGQVSTSLRHHCSVRSDIVLITLGRPEFDLDQPERIAEVIASYNPDIVVSAAAWTAVDAAEDDPESVMRANGESAGQVALGAAMAGAPIIHLSTDYVFDGNQSRAWVEEDQVNPLSVYGKTKLAGELLVKEFSPMHIILRTAWVYSPFGNNFVKTMLKLSQSNKVLKVVDDQYGCPTSAYDIADGIITIADTLFSGSARNENIWGVYHLSGRGTATWYDFAREIFRLSERVNISNPEILAVDSSAFPTIAVRPKNSRLNCTKLENTFSYSCPPWGISLNKCLQELASQEKL